MGGAATATETVTCGLRVVSEGERRSRIEGLDRSINSQRIILAGLTRQESVNVVVALVPFTSVLVDFEVS